MVFTLWLSRTTAVGDAFAPDALAIDHDESVVDRLEQAAVAHVANQRNAVLLGGRSFGSKRQPMRWCGGIHRSSAEYLGTNVAAQAYRIINGLTQLPLTERRKKPDTRAIGMGRHGLFTAEQLAASFYLSIATIYARLGLITPTTLHDGVFLTGSNFRDEGLELLRLFRKIRDRRQRSIVLDLIRAVVGEELK